MSEPEPLPKLADAKADERTLEGAIAQFVRWLFGPPGRHSRGCAVHMSNVPVAIPTESEASGHGKTSDLSAA